MKFAKTKTILTLSLILMLTTITLSTEFTSDAQVEIATFLSVIASPNPVGVGQLVYLGAVFSKPAPTVAGFSGDMYQGVTIDITDPSGQKTVMGPYTTSAAAGIQFSYIPTEVGNYTIQAHYPGQTLTGKNPANPEPGINLNMVGSKMLPDDSDIFTLVVQQEPVTPLYKTPPLPTEFWTRPIFATNWQWGAEIGSNWYGLNGAGGYDANGNFMQNGTAPNSPHIVWTKPTQFGGQPGSPINSDASSQYSSSSLIQMYFKPICILNGILYYNKYASPNGYNYPSSGVIGWQAIDVHTGEVLWDKPAGTTGTEAILYGQVVNYNNFQEFGSNAILYSQPGGGAFGATGGRWVGIYDAYTGTFLANITNAVSSRLLVDKKADLQGAIVGYYVSGGNLCMYNITKLLCPVDRPPSFWTDTTFFRPRGTINGSDPKATEWSVPLPTTFNGDKISLSIAAVTPDVILMRQTPTGGTIYIDTTMGYSYDAAYDARTGAKLWGPINQTGIWPAYQGVSQIACRDGYYVMHDRDTEQAWGFDLNTGKQVWGPVQLPGDAYSHDWRAGDIAYGKVYIWDVGGYVNAIDLKTGKLAWTYFTGNSGYDTPYGSYPIMGYGAHSIADGKLFLSEGHMYTPPLHPAYRLAINCTDGTLVWKLLQYSSTCIGAIGDGYLISWNSFDNQIYSIGKGPTTTTVSAAPEVSVRGSSVLVKGTVMDTSGGTKQNVITTRFPNGLPAVSEDSMEPWMEYAYQQQIRPINATGVDVVVTVLDPNNNVYEIGKTTTDASGFYKLQFTPEVSGAYTVIAKFQGSTSYYGSYAETAIGVSEASATVIPTPVQALTTVADIYLLPGIAAIIIAIAIVGAVLLMAIKRRP